MKKADQPIVDKIVKSLETNDRAVEKAILILGSYQTASEKESHAALVHNGQGFSRAHANFGMWAYNIIMSGGHLRGKALVKAREIALRYARTQLLDRAKEKLVSNPR